jgi:ATP citrate lyase citrate-binding
VPWLLLLLLHPLRTFVKSLVEGDFLFNLTPCTCTPLLQGIIHALDAAKDKLVACNMRIYVRRAGPNYRTGLRLMREVGERVRTFGCVYVCVCVCVCMCVFVCVDVCVLCV